MYIYAYIHTYIHIHMHMCMCMCMCIGVHVCLCVYIYIYTYIALSHEDRTGTQRGWKLDSSPTWRPRHHCWGGLRAEISEVDGCVVEGHWMLRWVPGGHWESEITHPCVLGWMTHPQVCIQDIRGAIEC